MSEPGAELAVVPANQVSWEDLELVFGTRGSGARCWCQRYKLAPKESFGSVPSEERAFRLRQQAECGHPESDTTSGLVAVLDGEPVGWCAVEPRPEYAGLLRVFKVPWEGRDEDRDDPTVWAVTCLFTRSGYRKRGVSKALARAAVDFARGSRRPRARGLPDHHDPGDRRGAARGHGADVPRRRAHGGQPPYDAALGDADRLLSTLGPGPRVAWGPRICG